MNFDEIKLNTLTELNERINKEFLKIIDFL
jgi:hypothetical protein